MKKEHVRALIEAHETLAEFYYHNGVEPLHKCPLCMVDTQFRNYYDCKSCTYIIKENRSCEKYWKEKGIYFTYSHTDIKDFPIKQAYHEECIAWWKNHLQKGTYKNIQLGI